jgi:hypothetical protein
MSLIKDVLFYLLTFFFSTMGMPLRHPIVPQAEPITSEMVGCAAAAGRVSDLTNLMPSLVANFLSENIMLGKAPGLIHKLRSF